MNVGSLFNGIAVIIDDEINLPGTTISTIKEIIENKNIPVAVYNEIPRQEVIPALSNASFIILDWDYNNNTNNTISIESEERIIVPSTLAESQESKLFDFIRALLSEIFVPVFIFSFKSSESVISSLTEAGLWNNNKPNRIFVKQKNDITSEELLFGAIEDWLKAMPSVYVLKEWEKVVSFTKNTMFLELYDYSPNWVKIIWDMIEQDCLENHQEFGSFVTRSLNNRIKGYDFDEAIINAPHEISNDELRRVVEGERYLVYASQPGQAYTGDLFKDGRKYYLNIRAQCDLSRTDEEGNYNPILYCIMGEKLRSQDITTNDIRLTSTEQLIFGSGRRYSLDQLRDICKDESKLPEFNRNFIKHTNGIFFRKGAFIERNDKVIIGCVANEQAIQFDLTLYPMEFHDIKQKRIGRILPPYITRIQQKCAQNMVREGVMPMPKELFTNFE